MVKGSSDRAHGDSDVSRPAPYKIAPLTGVRCVSCVDRKEETGVNAGLSRLVGRPRPEVPAT